MTEGRCGVVGAQEVLHDLNRNMENTSRYQREIDVSFRENGRAVGRRDFATHMIHWYPAKMFHRIPSVFLDTIQLPTGAIVLDPFCGSGTVLLEANLRGHHAVGLDINPLARLISQVKLTPLDPCELYSQLFYVTQRAKRSRSTPCRQPTLDSWLSPSARVALHRLISAIEGIAYADVRAFFLVSLTSIVRGVSLADPAIPPLVRLREDRAHTAGHRYQRALQRSRSVTTSSVYSAFVEAANSNIRRMSELVALRPEMINGAYSVVRGEAAHTDLASGSIDAIITSPPYCGAQKYVRSLKLELILSGYPEEDLRRLDRQTLGTEAVTTRPIELTKLVTGTPYVDRMIRAIHERNPTRAKMASDYCRYLATFARECLRLLRPGGDLLVTLGRSTLAGVPLLADRVFRRAGQELGFEFVATLVDRIPSRGLLTQRHRTAGRIDHEFIVWLKRPYLSTPSNVSATHGSN